MLQIHARECKCIDLGRRGEDSARVILFDITGFAELYGQGEARLVAIRNEDTDSYPVSITQDNTTVRWIVKPVDNDKPGYGSCELVYVTNGVVAKSTTYRTRTGHSLSDPISPPDSPTTYEGLQKQINELRAELEKGAEFDDMGQLSMLIEADMLPAVHVDGKILTDEQGRIILRY